MAGIKECLEYFDYLFTQDEADEALARLRAEELKSEPNVQELALYFLEDGGAPIIISKNENPQVVATEIREYLDDGFGERKGPKEDLVRKHLSQVVERVDFCLKQSHADGMGTPLVYAAAAWLGKRKHVLLRADEQGWMKLDGGEWFKLCPE